MRRAATALFLQDFHCTGKTLTNAKIHMLANPATTMPFYSFYPIPGDGNTLYLTLSRRLSDTLPPAQAPAMPKTILIADDNSTIRYLIRYLLERKGFVVCAEAENGAQAVEQAKRTKPDLILLDLSMPTMNGAEASSVLKRMMPLTPVLLFTLHGDTLAKSLAASAGADLLISKSDGIDKLVDGIHSLANCATPAALHSRNAYSPWIGRQVGLQIAAGESPVLLRGFLVRESSDALRLRIEGSWDVDIFKEMILRVDADDPGIPDAA
jgi:CheY-like chemotaxis protein